MISADFWIIASKVKVYTGLLQGASYIPTCQRGTELRAPPNKATPAEKRTFCEFNQTKHLNLR